MIHIPDNKRLVYDKMDVTIAIGQSLFSKSDQLREGECVGVKFVDISDKTLTHPIDASIKDSRGSEIIGEVDYRNLIHNGGGNIESFIQCNFDTRGLIKVSFNSNTNIAGTDFVGQLVFALLINK